LSRLPNERSWIFDSQLNLALPWERSPCQLWSLWEIMQKFSAAGCVQLFEEMTLLAQLASTDEADRVIPDGTRKRVDLLLPLATLICTQAYLLESSAMIERIQRDFAFHITSRELQMSLIHLQDLMKSEMDRQLFLAVLADDGRMFGQDRLFGDDVYGAFPSARKDIQESGNCLACERATACIFHLMRAAEIALRVLAWDRRVTFVKRPHVPIQLRQWDDILKELDSAERKIEGYKQSFAREAQLAFYHGAMIEFRAFKNLYRHRTAHARENYDIDRARSAMTHVSGFMKILASKISESKRTPTVWKKAQL
jgi:hypothetical protein